MLNVEKYDKSVLIVSMGNHISSTYYEGGVVAIKIS